MLRQMKAEAMKKKKEIKQKTKSDDDDEDYVVSDEDSRHTESKVKLKKKNDKPWMNSSSESSSESEPEEDYIEPEHSDLQSLKSDHEFSPESDLEDETIDRSTLDSPESPPTHGKDIRNIVKAIRKEEEKLNRSHSNSPVLDEKKKQMKNPLRKKKKLNSLDVSSEEDDGSDEDFAEDITSSDEESFSMTEDSESSLEFTRTKKSRAAANKKKDKDFINDNDDDSDNSGAYNIRKRPNKAKKILDDSDEFNEDDDVTESEEIDSEDLCNDTETDSSDDNWKKRKSNAKVVSRVPVKVNDNTKKKAKKPDDDKTYKSVQNQTTVMKGSQTPVHMFYLLIITTGLETPQTALVYLLLHNLLRAH
ncbi:dentin sialophosphoprotein-like [Aedes albopictus]|uniref:Uncharacterized protein n=1 Tax=Aedes albopictus TaxID=7160 RepID=A0ABM1YUK6_AEDAL